MFYPQLRDISIYNLQPDLIEQFDMWLATLPRTVEDKITLSKVHSVLGCHLDICKLILKFCCDKKILKDIYAIKCPRCGHIMKICEANEVYDYLEKINYCSSCEAEEIVCNEKNIMLMYKRIKSPTGSPTERKTTIDKFFDLNIDSLTSAFEKDGYDFHKFFYSPKIEEKETLKKLIKDIDEPSTNTTEQGDKFQAFVKYLFELIKNFIVSEKIHSKGTMNELDCFVTNKFSFSCTIFEDFGSVIQIECKNEQEKPDNNYIHKLYSLMRSNDSKFGILVSREKATRNCFNISRDKYIEHKNNNTPCMMVLLDKYEIEQMVDKDLNLLDLLFAKMNRVKINPTEKSMDEPMFKILKEVGTV